MPEAIERRWGLLRRPALGPATEPRRRPAVGHIGWRQAREPYSGAADGPPPEGESWQSNDGLVARLVYSTVALYAVTFAILSVLQHESFQTHAFDLGNMDQAVWNTAQGRPFEFTNWSGGNSRLAAHVEPILLLVALAYKLHSSPATLLVIQSLTIGLGALPAYWLAHRVLGSALAGAVFAFSYLLAPALEIANLADFHAVALSSAFIMFAFYYAYSRAYLPFFLFAILAMATKEHVPLTVFLLGVYVALVQRDRRTGYVTCGIAAAWAVVAFWVVIPHFNPERVSPYLSRYDQLGATPLDIVWRLVSDPGGAFALVTEPAKQEFLRQLFQPTLYLSLLSPFTLVMALPDLGINLLSNFPEMYLGRAHYGAVLVPVVTVSAILGAGHLLHLLAPLHPRIGGAARWLLAGSVLASSLTAFYTQAFLPLADHPPESTPHHRRVREVLAQLPPGAAVSATSTLNPHVSQRRSLSLFPETDGAEYVLADVTSTAYPVDAANQWWRLQGLLESGEWGVVAAADGALLLRRGGGEREAPPPFYTFTAAAEEDVGISVGVPFGGGLTLVGYTLRPGTRVHGAGGYARLDLFWRAEETLSRDFLVEVAVVDVSPDRPNMGHGMPGAPVANLPGTAGELPAARRERQVFTDRHQAATLWRPPTRWPAGELVRVHVPWLPLLEASRAEVQVSLVERGDPYTPLAGHRPEAESGRLRDGGTSLLITTLSRG